MKFGCLVEREVTSLQALTQSLNNYMTEDLPKAITMG